MNSRILLICVLYGCMALPEQPPLTESEKLFFEKLSIDCDCEVAREVDPRPPYVRLDGDTGYWYLISFNNVARSFFDNDSLLKIHSKEVSQKLEREILKKDFKFKYDDITVCYKLRTSNSGFKAHSYEYDRKELK